MNEQVQDNLPVAAGLPGPMSGLPSIEEMRSRMQRMAEMETLRTEFIKSNLKKDVDWGVIPGTEKPVIYKPGAEKINLWYGYYCYVTLTSEKEDFDCEIFAYVYRCEVRQIGTNIVVAVCEGDASTRETKYGYQWVTGDKLPADTDLSQMRSRTKGKETQYRIISENPADKRNTCRKMAQKRAIIGGTVLACALSGVFAADVIPGDDDDGDNSGAADHGEPISVEQGKRLYAIRMGKGLDNKAFKPWLKARYGYDDDRKIGVKVYDEICKACESGKLEMPASKPAAEPTPATSAQPASSGSRITVAQTKDFYMLLNSLGKTEPEFKEWLKHAFPQYDGKGINDLMSGEVDSIKFAFQQYCEGEAA